ncbi:MAG TPA: FUSC family protein [Candidatus Acidoferrum sp.]|nr:FUSC family protein [Candidatus Acidoferrum sp.]
MASSNLSLPVSGIPAYPSSSSFWSRESTSIKQGIKTGLAGTITYAIYSKWNLPQGYWAVFAALVVTQANVGASWKAALYRTIGSTSGALAAALLLRTMGSGSTRAGVALFILASFFAYLTALHPSFSAAGFSAALILVFGGVQEPWHVAWLRVLYTLLGALVAFVVSVVIWPVHASVVLRERLANILQGAGALYSAVTAAALHGMDNEQQVRQLDRQLHDLRRGVTQQLAEARSELRFSRFKEAAFQAIVDQADQVRRRLTAMADDSSLYVHAGLRLELLPSLPALAERTVCAFLELAAALRDPDKKLDSIGGLEKAIRDLDSDLARLREQRATAPFTLDRMLPFWSFVFNLREVAQDLQQLASSIAELAE